MKYVGQRVCVRHLQNVNKSVDYFCLFRQEGPPRYKVIHILVTFIYMNIALVLGNLL